MPSSAVETMVTHKPSLATTDVSPPIEMETDPAAEPRRADRTDGSLDEKAQMENILLLYVRTVSDWFMAHMVVPRDVRASNAAATTVGLSVVPFFDKTAPMSEMMLSCCLVLNTV